MNDTELVRLNQLFVMKSAKSKGIDDYDYGLVPFVTNTENNNGVVGYVEPENGDRLFNGPAIAISGLGHATVQLGKFLPKGNGGDSLTILEPIEQDLKNEINSLKLELDDLLGLPSDEQYPESIKDIQSRILNLENLYQTLPKTGLKVADLISITAAFNICHKWRFSFGRKCSIERIKNLTIPLHLSPIREVWISEAKNLLDINNLINTKVLCNLQFKTDILNITV